MPTLSVFTSKATYYVTITHDSFTYFQYTHTQAHALEAKGNAYMISDNKNIAAVH